MCAGKGFPRVMVCNAQPQWWARGKRKLKKPRHPMYSAETKLHRKQLCASKAFSLPLTGIGQVQDRQKGVGETAWVNWHGPTERSGQTAKFF